MLGKLLNKYSKTYYSPNSYNNHFGVPLSLSNMNIYDNFGVFEVGMSKFNEINKLSALVKPHIAIITNISEAHLENFNDIKDIAKAKSEIIYNVQKEGTVVLNRDDKFFKYLSGIAQKNKTKVISFGYSKKADIKIIGISKNKKKYILKISNNNKIIFLEANHNDKNHILNILCTLCVLNELNLDLNKIKNFFKNYTFLKGRGKINRVKKYNKNFYLIDESYNANPLSVKLAIENFSNIKKKGKKKYLLFGDMLELGKNSNILHKRISKLINKSDIDKTYVYGAKSLETFKFLNSKKKGEIINDLKSFDLKISKILNNGDYLMIKGSNATKLHEISNKLLKVSTNVV